VHDLRVHDDERVVVHVDDGDALGAPDLRSGEADPLGGVHRLEHVVHEAAQLVGDLGDRRRVLSQDRVAEHADVEKTHLTGIVARVRRWPCRRRRR